MRKQQQRANTRKTSLAERKSTWRVVPLQNERRFARPRVTGSVFGENANQSKNNTTCKNKIRKEKARVRTQKQRKKDAHTRGLERRIHSNANTRVHSIHGAFFGFTICLFYLMLHFFSFLFFFFLFGPLQTIKIRPTSVFVLGAPTPGACLGLRAQTGRHSHSSSLTLPARSPSKRKRVCSHADNSGFIGLFFMP